MPKEVKLISLKLQLGMGRSGALVTTVGSHPTRQPHPPSRYLPLSLPMDMILWLSRVSISIWV